MAGPADLIPEPRLLTIPSHMFCTSVVALYVLAAVVIGQFVLPFSTANSDLGTCVTLQIIQRHEAHVHICRTEHARPARPWETGVSGGNSLLAEAVLCALELCSDVACFQSPCSLKSPESFEDKPTNFCAPYEFRTHSKKSDTHNTAIPA